jgi:hypothetical protein
VGRGRFLPSPTQGVLRFARGLRPGRSGVFRAGSEGLGTLRFLLIAAGSDHGHRERAKAVGGTGQIDLRGQTS